MPDCQWMVVIIIVVSLLSVVPVSTADSGQLVTPRKMTVLADGEGGDWNTGRHLCHSVNMTLATLDRHAFFFLVSQSFLTRFQRYAKKFFWIGLYHEHGRSGTNIAENYRWEADCEPMTDFNVFWDAGQPVAEQGRRCVMANNVTLRWKTEDCSARHYFLCQREEDGCKYQRTLPTCTLYITASARFTVPNGTPKECQLLCDTTLKQSLPCWGFTMTSEGCVLHYQSMQPHCQVHHFKSSAYFRTCFQIHYVDGPFHRQTSNKTWPSVPECRNQEDWPSNPHSTVLPQITSEPASSTQETVPDTALSTVTAPKTPPATTASLQSSPPSTSTTTTTTTKQATDSDASKLNTTSRTETAPPSSGPTTTTSETADTVTPAAAIGAATTTTSATPVRTIQHRHTLLTPAPTSHHNVIQPVTSSLHHRPPPSHPRHQCTCRCDLSRRRNKTAALREAEAAKQTLRVDVTTLSATRRRKSSASDDRVSSRGIAFIGIGFVATIGAWIVLPDMVSLLRHVAYGARPRERKGSRKKLKEAV